MDYTKLSNEELEAKRNEGFEATLEIENRKDYKDFKWCYENLFNTMKNGGKSIKHLEILFFEGEETHRFWIEKETITKIPF